MVTTPENSVLPEARHYSCRTGHGPLPLCLHSHEPEKLSLCNGNAYRAPIKLRVALLLWFFGGVFGAHRYYVFGQANSAPYTVMTTMLGALFLGGYFLPMIELTAAIKDEIAFLSAVAGTTMALVLACHWLADALMLPQWVTTANCRDAETWNCCDFCVNGQRTQSPRHIGF